MKYIIIIIGILVTSCASVKHKKYETETDAESIEPQYCIEVMHNKWAKIHCHKTDSMWLDTKENIHLYLK